MPALKLDTAITETCCQSCSEASELTQAESVVSVKVESVSTVWVHVRRETLKLVKKNHTRDFSTFLLRKKTRVQLHVSINHSTNWVNKGDQENSPGVQLQALLVTQVLRHSAKTRKESVSSTGNAAVNWSRGGCVCFGSSGVCPSLSVDCCLNHICLAVRYLSFVRKNGGHL